MWSSFQSPVWKTVPAAVVIAVVGLFYVKWFPYYNRAFVAASQHSIGKSILMGTSASTPDASWQAAIDYALAAWLVEIERGRSDPVANGQDGKDRLDGPCRTEKMAGG